jgi:hypothetical protein
MYQGSLTEIKKTLECNSKEAVIGSPNFQFSQNPTGLIYVTGLSRLSAWLCGFAACRVFEVETPIHDSIRELVTWECKEHGVNIMNVLANPKGKCWALESEFLEA